MNIIRKILHGFIRVSLKDRINIIKTLVVNFSFLPFKTAIKFPVIIYGPCKLGSLKGQIQFKDCVRCGMFKIGVSDPVRSIFSKSYLSISGVINIENNVVLRRGIHLQINKTAELSLKNNVYIGDDCTIIADKYIFIGESTRIGNNTVFIDTDFHYIIDINSGDVKPYDKPILIGKNNWIGGWCTIKKGTITPTGTIVAGPYSMLSKDYTNKIPEYSIIAGSPAKLLISGVRRVNNHVSEQMLKKYFINNTVNYKLEDLSKLDDFCLPI